MYWYIEHPTDSTLQLTTDEKEMLIFTSEKLAEARTKEFGQEGKVIGPRNANQLADDFGPCRKIMLVNGSSDQIETICGLSV